MTLYISTPEGRGSVYVGMRRFLLWLGTLMMMIEFDGDLQYCGFQPHLRAQKSGPFYNRSSVVCPNA